MAQTTLTRWLPDKPEPRVKPAFKPLTPPSRREEFRLWLEMTSGR